MNLHSVTLPAFADLYPDFPPAYVLQAKIRRWQGRMEEARNLYLLAAACEKSKERATGYYLESAKICFKNDDLACVLNFTEIAMVQDPGQPQHCLYACAGIQSDRCI